MNDATPVGPLSQPMESEYSTIISQYISYFNELPDAGKKSFVERTIRFLSTKTFTYIGMEETKVVPVLISAATVQIVMDSIHMNCFLTPDAYLENGEHEIFVRHVAPEGI